MTDSEIKNFEVIEDYVMGRLSSEKERAFEEHLLLCKQCLEDVQAMEMLQQGLKSDPAFLIKQKQLGRVGVPLVQDKRRNLIRRIAIAAGIMLLIVTPWYLFSRERTKNLAERDALVESLRRLEMPETGVIVADLGRDRSSLHGDRSPSTSIEVPESVTWLVLILEGELEGGFIYSLTLERDGEEVWTQTEITPSLTGSILINIPAKWLDQGRYVVQVLRSLPERESELEATFSFDIRRE